jgi:hypothetical protein
MIVFRLWPARTPEWHPPDRGSRVTTVIEEAGCVSRPEHVATPHLVAVAALLIRRIPLGGPATMRRLACGLRPVPSFGDPLRDEGVVGSEIPELAAVM